MSTRALMIVAVLAALVAPAPAEAGPGRAARSTERPAVSAGAATVHARAGKKKKRKRARRPARRPARKARRAAGRGAMTSNMPEGWRWPPSAAMRTAGDACKARLDALGVVWKPAAAIERVVTPITVPSMTFGGVTIVSWFRKPPFVMDCHLALGLTTFGKDLYELGVREVTFSSIYRYTKVRVGGRTKNTLSRHALGLAIDVRSVTDADGRVAVVATDYKLDDPLLLRLEDFLNDAGGFRTVLTPKNDPISHHDHFHVEVKLEY